MGVNEERVVMNFLRASEGRTQDVDVMTSLMAEDIVWQINVPLATPIVGREAARVEIERQNEVSTGMLHGSEIRAVASNAQTVFTERVDVVEIGGLQTTFRITGIFEVRDGKVSAWREYFDTTDPAQQLGVDATVFYEGVGSTASE
jgi:limonene-1,2-epoxide hydrolase